MELQALVSKARRCCEDLKIQPSIAGMVNQIPVPRSQEDPEFQASLNYVRNPVSMSYRVGESVCLDIAHCLGKSC